MDSRKQKRLGPAPFASFEKSFEDGNSANALLHTSVAKEDTEVNEVHRNGIDMEPPVSITSTTSTSNKELLQQSSLSEMQQQQEQPFKSLNRSSNLSNSTKLPRVEATNGNNRRRPPPLKATTGAGGAEAAARAANVVSSGDQQQHGAFRSSATLTAPPTPRIELSRASSSSHHEEDSRDSSPENVFEQVGTGTLQDTIDVGFREEGALELRSSTEELFFMDPEQQKEHDKRMQLQQQQLLLQEKQQQTSQSTKRSSPLMFKFDEHQNYLQQHQRKDSASSEVAALLCISGRTSRISSVGSQGSAMSRLSAVSGVSRSPSPHRMLLETSFCGPKPLENPVGGRLPNAVEPTAAEVLEQVLLARKSDPTQVVLAEGIRVENSPKRGKPRALSNDDSKIAAQIATALQNRPSTGATAKAVMGRQRQSTKSPGQMVIGKTPNGTEYIRINLKPDHMYNDKGIAPNERVVEAPDSLTPVTAKSSTQKKPISLSLGRSPTNGNRLTPNASPKPSRHGAVIKDQLCSRSPSPANIPASRKSSFSSLFRVGVKDSPDSPRDLPRSKSKDRQTPQSLSATPSKQKSVLAIFKPSKRGSHPGAEAKSSKSSSPVDRHEQHPQQGKRNTPVGSSSDSRPPSRLRYYDEPVEGCIHIPLHTPPEEKETRKLLQGIAQLNAEPMRPIAAPVTASQLAAAAAALKPVGARKASGPLVAPKPQQIGKLQRVENLDAIHMLPVQDPDSKERTWSLEVQRQSSSQDSQETLASDVSGSSVFKNSPRSLASFLAKHPPQERGASAAVDVHRLPQEESKGFPESGEFKTVKTVALVNSSGSTAEDAVAKEKRRLLFATRIGSGSEEQIFSTQFSISKTESQSSQLSEQAPNDQGDHLQRIDTILKRPEEAALKETTSRKPLKRFGSVEGSAGRAKSLSTSEDEKTQQQKSGCAVVLRHKDPQEESRRKSRSTSEDDVDGGAASSMANQRHSRYLENFDVRRKYVDNAPRKPKRQSISSSGKAEDVQLEEAAQPGSNEDRKPILPQPPPPTTAPSPSPPPVVPRSASGSRSPTPTKVQVELQRSTSKKSPSKSTSPLKAASSTAPAATSFKGSPQPDRQSAHSTDEPIESSESGCDSELAASSSVVAAVDPKRRHLPRHVGPVEDHESTGLVSQESFEDELPYVPTTLPEERAQGVALIPMKERANMELKMCSVDRPRSTTPLNPSHLEEYCGIVAATPTEPTFVASGTPLVRGEKLRISLPRKDSAKEKPQNTKSPRRSSNTSGKSWFEFAEEGLRATGATLERKDSNKQMLQQQTVPEPTAAVVSKVEKAVISRKLSGHWIDFENIPEKRKPAKRITTLPKDAGQAGAMGLGNSSARNHQGSSGDPLQDRQLQQSGPSDVPTTDDRPLHYNYVKPEDCQCECHEVEREGASAEGDAAKKKSLATVDLLQQGEDMLPLLDPDVQDNIEPSDSSRELSCYTDDEAEAPTRQGSLTRYRVGAMKTDEFPRRDVSRSPRNRKFPDHRYS